MVNDKVSSDLGQRDEGVLQCIALHPSFSAHKIGERYNLSAKAVLDSVDKLMNKGLVRQLPEDEQGDFVWRVTDLGRLRLLRLADVMSFEIREAELRGHGSKSLESLRNKKKCFEKAYIQSEEVFGGE